MPPQLLKLTIPLPSVKPGNALLPKTKKQNKQKTKSPAAILSLRRKKTKQIFFPRNLQTLPKWLCHLTVPIAEYEGSAVFSVCLGVVFLFFIFGFKYHFLLAVFLIKEMWLSF